MTDVMNDAGAKESIRSTLEPIFKILSLETLELAHDDFVVADAESDDPEMLDWFAVCLDVIRGHFPDNHPLR
ncbi:hypothetical protein [Bradyrhizobium elkanii]